MATPQVVKRAQSLGSPTEIPDLIADIQDSRHWLANHFLNSLFLARYNEAWKQRAIVFLFRAQNAVKHYGVAREHTVTFLEKTYEGRPFTAEYFNAPDHWEAVVSNLHPAVEHAGIHSGDDGRRLRLMVNRVKHVVEDVGSKQHASLTVPMRMTNEGLETTSANMSYAEFADNVHELAKAAEIMANPKQSHRFAVV